MTIIERVKQCADTFDGEKDNVEKLVAVAYYMGRGSATREVSDKYKKLIKEQRERANKCRYKHMAMEIIGDRDYIYNSNYGCEMTGLFGSDETKI
jgi:hypothetical protein